MLQMRKTNTYMQTLSRAGDRMMLVVVACLGGLSLILAPWHHTFDLVLAVGLPATLAPVLLAWLKPGELVTRCANIDQSHGMIEMHFGIFVLLAFLLIYRDWIPLVFAAGLIAIHHLGFDLLQRAGRPVYVFGTAGGIDIVLVHAAFVVFETGLLVWMAVKLRREVDAVGCDPTTLSRAASELASGNLDVPLNTLGVGARSLAGAMDTMRAELKSSFEKQRAANDENRRIRAALDHVAIGAMLIDPAGRILYLNHHMSELVRQRLPHLHGKNLIGAQMDLFQPGGTQQADLARAMESGRSVDLRVGDAALRVVANAVLDEGGRRLGSVVQWRDRTYETRSEEEVKAAVARATSGDLTAQIPLPGKDGFFKNLASGMNELISNMAGVIDTLSNAAAEVRGGADEISKGNLHLSERTEQQAANLAETSAGLLRMTAAVRSNADHASKADELAAAARKQAEQGGAVVGAAVAAMQEINAGSRKIADIIGVIDEIAFQTNLLALNAAVEAARAGEQGRGFAVVASEVRNLASRSAEAARQIKMLIQDSVTKINDGANLVNESGRVLGDIVAGARQVTDVVGQIAASSRTQATGIEQLQSSLASMDDSTQQNSALVEEASAAAKALSEQAGRLTQLIERYQVHHTAGAPKSATTSRLFLRAV
jgi:methyl-accepting chemotaxis protein